MFSAFFFETLKIAVPISILILVTYLLTSKVNSLYKATWRFPVWMIFAIWLCCPLGFIIKVLSNMPIGKSIEDELIAATVSRVTTTGDIPFEALIEKAEPTILIKLQHMIPNWIFYIWILGICIYCIILLIKYFYFRKDVRRWATLQINCRSTINTRPNIPVYRYPKIATPMLVGCFKPMILLPDIEYSEDQIGVIYKHEYTHYYRHDLWKKLLLQLALVLHWYNPIVHFMVRTADYDIELSCDSEVLKDKDDEYRALYTKTILYTIQKSINKSLLFAGWGSEKREAMRRFENIYDKSKRKNGKNIVIIIVILLIFSTFYIYAKSIETPFYLYPEYQALLNKAIAERNERAASETYDYIVLTKEMLDEAQREGIDEAELLKEQYKLHDAVMSPTSGWDKEIFYYSATSGKISPHAIDCGRVAIYNNQDNQAWQLTKGDEIIFEINTDTKYYDNKGGLSFGYLKDVMKPNQIEEFDIKNKKTIQFYAPQDGYYQFYLYSLDIEPIVIKWIEISL